MHIPKIITTFVAQKSMFRPRMPIPILFQQSLHFRTSRHGQTYSKKTYHESRPPNYPKLLLYSVSQFSTIFRVLPIDAGITVLPNGSFFCGKLDGRDRSLVLHGSGSLHSSLFRLLARHICP